MRTQTMARSVFALVCGAVALVLLATPADATVITVHTGDGAGADSYIRGGSNADLNHGQEANVYIKDSGTNNSYTRKGYLRFDLTGIDLSQVYDVALVQTVSNNNAPGGWTVDVWGLADGHAGEAWVEGNGGTGDSPAGEIDWNNAPGNNSSGSSMASPPMTEFGDLTVPSGVNGWGGPDGAAGAVIAFGTPTFTQFVTSDTDGLVTVALTRNNVNGNTGSHNLGFASKEHPTYGSPFLRLKIAEPGDGIVQFADTGFDATTAFAGDGTSDGPWEVARMQMNTGDPVNLAFSITSNTTFLGHTTGGHPGSFVAVQTTSTSNRALAFLGQRLAPSAGDLVTDVALSFDLQRNSPNSTRAPMIGLALFDATAWEARQPGQSLLDANDNPTSAANIGALWVTQLLQGGYQGDLFSWVGMTLTDLQVDDLVGALNQHIGEDLVLAVYETDYWNGTESFVYIDNFALTITYTPEPGTAMLLGMGGLALARRFRRRRKGARRGGLSKVAGLVVALAALALTAGNATAALITTSMGNGADAYVQKGNATTNYGAGPEVVIKDSDTGTTTRKGYFRFDIASLPDVMVDAQLDLIVSTNNQGGGGTTPQTFTVNVYGLNDAHAGENWGEGTINWNNAPANDPAREHLTNDAAFLGRFTVPALAVPQTVTFSGLALRSFLTQDTDGLATIILTRQAGSGGYNLAFAAKEHGSYADPLLTANGNVTSVVAQVTTNDGIGADAYIHRANPTSNYGTSTQLLSKNAGTSTATRKSYLRFDLPSLLGGAIDASLNLEVILNNQGSGGTTPQNQTVNVWGLNDLDPGELWDESLITWNNAPANDTADNDILSNATLLGSFLAPNNPETDTKPLEVLFTSQELIDFVNADTNGAITLILQRQTSNGSWNLGFASGEYGSLMAPTLTLGLYVPEPGTAMLLVMGGAALARRARRRRKA